MEPNKKLEIKEVLDNVLSPLDAARDVKENFRSIQFKQDRAAAIQMYDFLHNDALSVAIKEITVVVSTFLIFVIFIKYLLKFLDIYPIIYL